MKKIKAYTILVVFMGGFILNGCNAGIDWNDELRSLLLLSSDNPYAMTFNESGANVALAASSPALGWTGEGYIGGYLLNGTDVNNSVTVRWAGSPSISPATFNQDTGGFTFSYLKNGVLWRNAYGYSFTFTLSTVSGGQISGTFTGTLSDGSSNVLFITDGAFSGSYQ
ncbi:MAG: hypothetical protein A2W19_10710 [Spirochaetes bacterium RBG_16_49_21]|nr:MAG: hypothetical protein A2W19_10710 [Spirochaetes bacterium RBG_16_49_21]